MDACLGACLGTLLVNSTAERQPQDANAPGSPLYNSLPDLSIHCGSMMVNALVNCNPRFPLASVAES